MNKNNKNRYFKNIMKTFYFIETLVYLFIIQKEKTN